MTKENKNIKVQIRITSTEKALLDKLFAANNDLSISNIFRNSIYENCSKLGIIIDTNHSAS